MGGQGIWTFRSYLLFLIGDILKITFKQFLYNSNKKMEKKFKYIYLRLHKK